MRILHTADLHLGFRQYGMTDREVDFEASASRVIGAAKNANADIVTLGGDNFQSVKPPGRAVEALKTAVQGCGVPVYGVDGNHDQSEDSWLRVCGVHPLEKWDGDHPVPTVIEEVAIFGISYCAPSKLLEKMQKLSDSGTRIDVLLLHIALGDMFGIGFTDLTAEQLSGYLRTTGTRVVLLGDIHDYKEIVTGGVRFLYPGSPDMNSSSERMDKSFTVVDITPEELKTEVHPCAHRTMHIIRINTDADIEKLKEHTVGKEKEILLIDYSPEIENAKGKITSILEGQALYRAAPIAGDKGSFSELVEISVENELNRSGTMKYLSDVLDKDASGLGEDEKWLLKSLLSDTTNMEPTMRKALKEFGVES